MELSEVRPHILKELGFKSTAELKRTLKKKAKPQYGCNYAEIKGKGFKVAYTSNSNCFASYLVTIKMVGMSSSYALDKTSITPAGKKRGAGNYFLP